MYLSVLHSISPNNNNKIYFRKLTEQEENIAYISEDQGTN